MGHPRLDPFNHTIRRIERSTIDTDDRRHVLAMLMAFKNRGQLTLDAAVIVCAGLFAYAQALRVQREMETAGVATAKYRSLVLVHNSNIEAYRKALTAVGKPNIKVGKRLEQPRHRERSASSLVADNAASDQAESAEAVSA